MTFSSESAFVKSIISEASALLCPLFVHSVESNCIFYTLELLSKNILSDYD